MSSGEDNSSKVYLLNPGTAANRSEPAKAETGTAADLERLFPVKDGAASSFTQPKSPTETFEAKPATPTAPKEPKDFDVFNDKLPPPTTARDAPQRALGGPGNYIFAVGCPGSGKSTFQSHLFRYLATCGDYLVEPDVEFMRNGASFQKLRAEWQTTWETGAFPKASDVKQVTEFRYKVTPQTGHPVIPFGFLEISGEEFKKLITHNDQPRTLQLPIDQFLNNPQIKICFLFVCQGQDWKSDDFLFSEFLSYLSVNLNRNFKDNCSAVLILADPESCQRRLARALNIPEDGRALDVDGFIRHFTPLTVNQLAGWKNRYTIATFSVGRLKERTVDGKTVRFIAEPAFEDTRVIFNWIYEQFTGRGTGPGTIGKILDWLKSLGGRA